MNLDELKSFIRDAKKVLHHIPKDTFDLTHLLLELELPFYLNDDFDYQELKTLHFSLIKNYSNALRLLNNSVDESEELFEEIRLCMEEIYLLKRLCDNLIQNHPIDKEFPKTGLFEKEHNKKTNEIQFELKNKTKIIRIYQTLLENNRVIQNKSQIKALTKFLFNSDKLSHELIKWNNSTSDLRGFLVALIDLKLVAYNISDLNSLAAKKFLYLRKNEFKPINQNNFRSYQDREPFRKAKKFWIEKLESLAR